MSYFNDYEVNSRLINNDVAYTYNPKTIVQDIYVDANGGITKDKEIEIPANSIITTVYPTIAAMRHESNVHISSPAQFSIDCYGKHVKYEYLQHNIVINTLRQMAFSFDNLVAKYNDAKVTDIKVDDIFDVNQFSDLFIYFLKHLPTFRRLAETNHTDNPRYEDNEVYANDYSIIVDCLQELRRDYLTFDEDGLANFVFFNIIQKTQEPRFVTKQTIDDYINTFNDIYQSTKQVTNQIDDGGYINRFTTIAKKLEHIKATLGSDMDKYPDGLINVHNGQFWTYRSLITFFRHFDDAMDYKTSIAYKSMTSNK